MENKILKITSIFVLIYGFAMLADVNINDPIECPKGMTKENKSTCCTNFNNKRQIFSVCCQYPGMVIFAWQYDVCFALCFESGAVVNVRCCVLQCGLKFLKVLGENPATDGVDVEGLKFSFMLSVDNDTRWADPIDQSVTRCSNQFRQDIPKLSNSSTPEEIKAYEDFWDCFETVPKYLYSIIDCAYYANFIKCPVYNEEVEGCNYTQRYVQDCLINVDE